MYTAIIIGCGPSGLLAAKALGNNRVKSLIIEKGLTITHRICPMTQSCYHCRNCHEVEGVGGAGGYSDGKLCNGPVGIAAELMGFSYQDEIRMVNNVIQEVLGNRYQSSKDIPSFVKKGNKSEEVSEVVSLGSSAVRDAFQTIYDRLPIDKICGHKVVGVDYVNGAFTVMTGRDHKYRAKYVILATGKSDFTLRSILIRNLNLSLLDGFPLLGVRLEVPKTQLNNLSKKGTNPKLKKYYNNGEFVKTHCFCFAGEVMSYACGPYFLVGGRSDKNDPTPNANMNILYKSNTHSTTKLIFETLDLFAKTYPNNAVFQSIGSFICEIGEEQLRVHPCRGSAKGYLNNLYPNEILQPLQDFIRSMMQEGLIDITGGVAYGPAAEWIAPNFDITHSMESSFPGLFIVGDTSGKTQGIVAAAVTGLRAAEEILHRESIIGIQNGLISSEIVYPILETSDRRRF